MWNKAIVSTGGFVAMSVLGAHMAQASVLMFDFGPTTVVNNTTNSPLHVTQPSFTGTTWNKSTANDLGTVKYADGTTATGVAFNFGRESGATTNLIDLSNNPSSNQAGGGAYTTGIYAGDSVAKDFVFQSANDFATGFQITGLAAGVYNVYVVARNTAATATPVAYPTNVFVGAGTAAGNFDFSTLSSAALTNTASTTTWVAGDTYVQIQVALGVGEVLNVAVQGAGSGANGRGFINAAQIALVPEPATLSLLGLGVALCMGRRRRDSASN